jgi:hypothetical protein
LILTFASRHPDSTAANVRIGPLEPRLGAVLEKDLTQYPLPRPDDWTRPDRRIDQWGISDKDFAGLIPTCGDPDP